MLSDDKWLLIENLLDLLFGFEEVTRLLSSAKYYTISSIYLAILTLIISIKAIQVDQITILDNIKVIIDDNENEVKIEVIDLTSNTDHNKKKLIFLSL